MFTQLAQELWIRKGIGCLPVSMLTLADTKTVTSSHSVVNFISFFNFFN